MKYEGFLVFFSNRIFQVQHNFRMFLLPNNMDAIRGYMGRFLRRRILEGEFGGDERSSPEIFRVVEFLPRVLSSVNSVSKLGSNI